MNPNEQYVVGIGSSAGGLPALMAFLKSIVADENTAYVVVQHLKIDQDSKLATILGRECLLPVVEINDNEEVKSGNVYVMPAGFKLRLEKNVFKLDRRLETEIVNRSIDYFFVSLAKEIGAQAFGVILSGTGSDGVEGVKEIERCGGLVLVQDPATAQFDGMPENTINKDHPDYVIAPEAMGPLINELQKDRDSHPGERRTY